MSVTLGKEIQLGKKLVISHIVLYVIQYYTQYIYLSSLSVQFGIYNTNKLVVSQMTCTTGFYSQRQYLRYCGRNLSLTIRRSYKQRKVFSQTIGIQNIERQLRRKDIRKVRSITYISTRVGRLWPISISTHCSKSNSLKKHIYLNIRTSQHCTIQTHVYKNNINCPVTTRSSIAGYNR